MGVKRTSGNAAYTYYYNGDLLRYLDYDSDVTDPNTAAKLYFVLDANGQPIEVSYRPEGSTETGFYYYVHNLQGDVEAIVNSSDGNVVVWYTYDAWGNVLTVGGTLATTLGELNPFRYRSYVYDEETALYYLQSRYYDPEMGRFINADALTSTGQGLIGNNMFTYCGNNPVHRADIDGESWLAVIGAIGVQYASDVLGNILDGKTGTDVFIPTSSLATYTAAAITAIIPGGSIASAIIRSAVSETILWVDNNLNGRSDLNNLKKSLGSIVGNAVLDFSMGKLMDNTFGVLGEEELSTFSSKPKYRNSGATLEQAYNMLQRSNTIGRAVGKMGIKVCEVAVNYCLG